MFNKKRFAGITLAGMIALTGAVTAFAANQTSSSQQSADQRPPVRINASQMSELVKSTLDSLVTSGTINQEQEDAVLKTLPSNDGKGGFDRQRKGGPGGQRVNPMDSLVTAGTITQEQADAIQNAMESARDSKKSMKDILDDLVTAGTITQAQEDAIIKTLPSRDGKGGSKGERKSPMDSLVTAGTITQEQADAVQSAIKTGRDSNKTMEDVLGELVTAGTITEAQKEAILKDLPSRDGKGGPGGQRPNHMDSLVTAGTITQEQADAIQNALKTAIDSVNKAE